MFVVGYTKQYSIPIADILPRLKSWAFCCYDRKSCPEQLGEKHGGDDTIILAHDEH